MLPKFLNDIIDNFSIDKIFTWIKETILFFIFPKKFFKFFFEKPNNEQNIQIIFYTSLNVLFLWILLNTMELRDISRFILSLLIFTFLLIIPTSIIFLILNKSEFNLRKIFIFNYLSWLLFSFPTIFFFNLFIRTESYSFYFLSTLINVVSFLFSIFVVWRVFFDRILKIILGCVLNILLLNILFFLSFFIIIKIDPHSNKIISDPIIDELTETLNNVQIFAGSPYRFIDGINIKNRDRSYEMLFLHDNVITSITDNDIFIYEDLAKKNAKYLDSVTAKLNFSRNKEILNLLSIYLKKMSKYSDEISCDTCLIRDVISRDLKDSTIRIEQKEYIIEDQYKSPYIEFDSKEKELIKASEYANSPNYINMILFKPAIFLLKKAGVTKKGFSIAF